MKTTVSLREGSEATDKAISYYHTDHLGSSSVITDENGNKVSSYEYQPYGQVAKQTGSDVTNYKFTGKELDSTGLYYYSARYYDPEIGRFTQADTIVQSPYDPQSLNRYTYCRNNPIKYIDPTGHFGFLAQLITTIIVIAIGWGLDQTGHAEVNVSGGTSIPFGGGPRGSGGGTNQPSTSSSSGYYPSANSYADRNPQQSQSQHSNKSKWGYGGQSSSKLIGNKTVQETGVKTVDGKANSSLIVDKGKGASRDPIIDDPAVRAERRKAYKESYVSGQYEMYEQGGWITKENGNYSVQRWSQGSADNIISSPKPLNAVADFHTHPQDPYHTFDYFHKPSSIDYMSARMGDSYGLNHYIVNQQGVISYAPAEEIDNLRTGTYREVWKW